MDKKRRIALGNRIKNARKNFNFTQEEAAELLDIAYSSYSKIESGFQSPSLDLLIRISELYSVKIDYLIYGNDENNLNDFEKLKALINSVDKKKLRHANIIISKLLEMI